MDKKRERGKNYTETEKYTLLNIVEEYLHIIENKKTDDSHAKKKKDTWNLIANRYNAVQITGVRTGSQLRLLYENIKQKAKKDRADEKVEIYKTGGGTFCKKVCELSEKCLQMNEAAICDMPNKYDSSAMLDVNVPVDNHIIVEVDSDVQTEFLLNKNFTSTVSSIVTNPSSKYIRSESEFIQEPSSPLYTTTTPTPTKSSANNKDKDTPFYKKRRAVEKEDIKVEILKIRLEKEKIDKDILLLKKEEKHLKIKQKKIELKILARNEGFAYDSD